MFDLITPMIHIMGPILGLIDTRPRKIVFKEVIFQLDYKYAEKTYFPFLKKFANVAKDETDIGRKLWIDKKENAIGILCRREYIYIIFTKKQSWYLTSGSHRGFRTEEYHIPFTKSSFISALETIKNKKTFLLT